MPKHGDLRVWWIPQIPGKMFQVPVANVLEARLLYDTLAAYAPTRVKCPDGRIVVWRCPEHLIPLTDLSGSETVSKEVK